MSDQLLEWKGTFGRDYTDRNVVDWQTRVDGFNRMLLGIELETILEVGCNRGHNLQALCNSEETVVGVEPGDYARRQAIDSGLVVLPADIYSLPFDDATFDLVFTCGVLIHVPPDLIDQAVEEVIRVSRRYVLAIEYHADTDTEVEYRGRPAMMWNRDYGSLYEDHGLTLVRSGMLGAEFDTARFALLTKPARSRNSATDNRRAVSLANENPAESSEPGRPI